MAVVTHQPCYHGSPDCWRIHEFGVGYQPPGNVPAIEPSAERAVVSCKGCGRFIGWRKKETTK